MQKSVGPRVGKLKAGFNVRLFKFSEIFTILDPWNYGITLIKNQQRKLKHMFLGKKKKINKIK